MIFRECNTDPLMIFICFLEGCGCRRPALVVEQHWKGSPLDLGTPEEIEVLCSMCVLEGAERVENSGEPSG